MTEREALLISLLGDLMAAEADYRSAMHIYKDHPNHMTRIRAESRWRHAKTIASTVLRGHTRVDGERMPERTDD